MKKRLIITLSVLTALVLVISVSFYIYRNFFKAKSVDLSYGDSFPKIDIYHHSGVKADFSKAISKYKVIFYVSNHCQACLENLDAVSRIIKLYDTYNFEFIVLWEGGLPKDRIKKAGIEIDKNYSLRNLVKLSILTPKGFIIDENNKVIFSSNADFESLTEKIVEIQGSPDYKQKVFEIIKNDYLKISGNKFNIHKPSVIVFSTDGCEECSNVKNEISNNIQLKNKANIIVIETSNFDDDGSYYDYLNLFSRILNIDFYPSYYVFDSEGNPIKYYKTLQETINQIASS